LLHEFKFPDGRKVSQVKIAGNKKVFVASLSGVIAILREKSDGSRGFETERIIPANPGTEFTNLVNALLS
jgi:hypothetical protein